MKKEISAGGLVVRKYRSTWQILIVKDMNKSWTFPKGKIEPGESESEAAVREIGEEVGLHDLTQVTELPKLTYMYKRNGLIDKTVYYYVFRYNGREKPKAQAEEGLSQASWVTFKKAIENIGYPKSNIPLLLKTMELLGIS